MRHAAPIISPRLKPETNSRVLGLTEARALVFAQVGAEFDIELLGNCDAIVAFLSAKLNWDLPGRRVTAAEHEGKCSSRSLGQTGEPPFLLSPRTYCFEGAQIRQPDDRSSENVQSVAYSCDGCGQAIDGSRFNCRYTQYYVPLFFDLLVFCIVSGLALMRGCCFA